MIFDVFKKLVGSSPQVMDVNVMAKLEQVQGEWMFSVYQENPAWNVYVPLVTCDSKVADQIYNYMNQRRGSDWARLHIQINKDANGAIECKITED